MFSARLPLWSVRRMPDVGARPARFYEVGFAAEADRDAPADLPDLQRVGEPRPGCRPPWSDHLGFVGGTTQRGTVRTLRHDRARSRCGGRWAIRRFTTLAASGTIRSTASSPQKAVAGLAREPGLTMPPVSMAAFTPGRVSPAVSRSPSRAQPRSRSSGGGSPRSARRSGRRPNQGAVR